jgi:hypothetical protein
MKVTKWGKETGLDKEINHVLSVMGVLEPDSEKYATMAKNLETLYKAKSNEKDRKVSPDTIAVVLGNLLGIGIILTYEKANIIVSKALGFVIKGRV